MEDTSAAVQQPPAAASDEASVAASSDAAAAAPVAMDTSNDAAVNDGSATQANATDTTPTTIAADSQAASTQPTDATVAADSSSQQMETQKAGDEDGDEERRKKKEKKKKHKDKKEKKRKKHKEREERRKKKAAEGEGDEEAGDEAEDGSDAESSASPSASSPSDDEAEIRDKDEERRRARKKARKERKHRSKKKSRIDDSDDDEEDSDDAPKKKRRRARDASKYLEMEVEVSSDEEVSEDEEDIEEGEEGPFLKDLVVPDDEFEASRERDYERRRKRKRGRRIIEEEVDAEELELMAENLGAAPIIHIDKDIGPESEDDESAAVEGVEGGRKRLKKASAKPVDWEALAREKAEKEAKAEEARRKGLILDEEEEEVDADAAFIAPEDDEGFGKAKRRGKRAEEDDMDNFIEDDTRIERSHADAVGEMSSAQKERLREVFGDVTHFFLGKKQRSEIDGAYGEEGGGLDEEEEVEEVSSEEEMRDRLRKIKLKEEALKRRSTVQAERERQLHQLRYADIPERLVARHNKLQSNLAGLDMEAIERERMEECIWIYQQLYVQPFAPFQRHDNRVRSHDADLPQPLPHNQSALPRTIDAVLRLMHEEKVEIYYIISHKREVWRGSDLAPQQQLSEEEMMKIDELDARWIELGARRRKIIEVMQQYRKRREANEQATGTQSMDGSGAAGMDSSNADPVTRASDWAAPTFDALDEWHRLLSGSELSGNMELDDVQDALRSIAVVEECRRRADMQRRRGMRDHARRERRRMREERRKEKEERKRKEAEEREKRRAEMADSFAAGMAAAAEGGMDVDEEKKVDEEERKSEPESVSEGEEEDDVVQPPPTLPDAFFSSATRSNRSHFSILRKCWSITGTPLLAAAIGIKPSHFAVNVRQNYKMYDTVDSTYNPEFLADEAIRFNKVASVDDALTAARRYAALLLSLDPVLRRCVREHFFRVATLWTFPTAKGVRELDETHEYSGVRRLEDKPIIRMAEHPAQFMLVHQAEQEGFIRVEWRLPPNTEVVNSVPSLSMEPPEADPITAQLCKLYLSSSVSADATSWNEQRRLIIHDLMQTFLLPLCHTFVRTILLRAATEFICTRIDQRLTRQLTMSGFQPRPDSFKDAADERGGRGRRKKGGASASDESSNYVNWRIFSMIVGDAQSPSYVAVLNRFGGVIDHVCLHFLKVQTRIRPGEQPTGSERTAAARKKGDVRKFVDMVATHKPKLLVLDASSIEVRQLKDEIRHKILLDYPDLPIELVDPEVSRIYMNSARAELEFKEYPRNLRQAISLGRRALDPIAEVAGLYSGPGDASQWSESASSSSQLLNNIQSGRNEEEVMRKDIIAAATNALSNDMLALNLHPCQRMIPTRLFLSTLSRTLCRLVNYQCVDMNRILQRPWLSGSLQFVAGLGPIKAKLLMDYAKKKGYIVLREELQNKEYEEPKPPLVKMEDGAVAASQSSAAIKATSPSSKSGLFGPIVYRNCAGFLVIRPTVAMPSTIIAQHHPLDETRIHPQMYAWALSFVRYALGGDEAEDAKEIERKVERAMKKKKHEEDDEDEDEDEDEDDDDEMGESKQKERPLSDRERLRKEKLRARITRDLQIDYFTRAMSEPGRLSQADVEAAAEMARDTPGAHDILWAILEELRAPLGDHKRLFKPFSSPPPHQLFYLLTGESTRTLREGLLLPVVVSGIHPQGKGAYVRLDNGVRGFLNLRNVSDSAPRPPRRDLMSDPAEIERDIADQLTWLKARLAPGLHLTARVVRIEKERFMVELSTRSSDLDPDRWEAEESTRKEREMAMNARRGYEEQQEDDVDKDIYFHDEYLHRGKHDEDAELLRAEAGPLQSDKRFHQRNITHALFRNCSREEAVSMLHDKPVGEVIFRPSSLGTDHLTLTWKVSTEEFPMEQQQAQGSTATPLDASDPNAVVIDTKGLCFHVDVEERRKPNDLELGKELVIKRHNGEESIFEDMDEINARFIQPMLPYLRDLTAHKNFRYGSAQDIHAMLLAEKQQNRNKIPYALHFAHTKERAGAFQFSFMPNQSVKSSSFTITPDG